MNVDEIFERVLAGMMRLPEVETWVKQSEPAYRRPSLTDVANGGQRLVDRYVDWDDRMRELVWSLNRYYDVVENLMCEDLQQALLVARTRLCLAQLLFNAADSARCAMLVGQVLRQLGRWFDTADVFASAVAGFREAGQDPVDELLALNRLCEALREDKQHDEALLRADEMLARAQQSALRGCTATALYNKGLALANLSKRDSEALDCLRQATALRRQLDDAEEEQQVAQPLADFLQAQGETARRFGGFEEAIATFGELAELATAAGDQPLAAYALSDLGYTYVQLGDRSKAGRYLADAAQLARSHGLDLPALRWGMAAATFGAAIDETDDVPNLDNLATTIDDPKEAYFQATVSEWLVARDRFDDAAPVAARVAEWARREQDLQLEMNARNLLGACHSRLGQPQRAVSEFQRAIYLADGTGAHLMSVKLRGNLAKVYAQQKMYQRGVDVLLTGIVYVEELLESTETTEIRQQVVANIAELYEEYAFLFSRNDDHENRMQLLAITELVRGLNLAGWLRATRQIESGLAKPDAAAGDALRGLRRAEIELEVRHLTGAITPADMASLQQRRRSSKAILDALFARAGLPALSWSGWGGRAGPFRETDALLADVIAPDLAAICFFVVPKGICPVVIYHRGEELYSEGEFIAWDRDERLTVLGNLRAQRPGEGTARSRLAALEQTLGTVRHRVLRQLAEILGRIQPRRLVIVPHRELNLIPFWELLDGCPAIQSFVVVPSLKVLRICEERQRLTRGPTVIMGDPTGTLSNTETELRFVRAKRDDDIVVEPASIAEAHAGSRGCSLLHVATHGLYNARNPYFSGLLVGKGEHETGIFVQYATPYASNPTIYQDSPGPKTSSSIRLLTVAECMGELTLGACRLAVLSSCESGVSRDHAGGELTGLPNSLLVAGARSVIASLWRVGDAASAALMHYFYSAWEGGGGAEPSPAHALAEARQRLRAASRDDLCAILGSAAGLPNRDLPFAHPLYSDAFQCYGSW